MKQTPISRTIFNLRVKIAVLLSSASERTDHSLQKLADKIMPEVNVNRLHVTTPMEPNEDGLRPVTGIQFAPPSVEQSFSHRKAALAGEPITLEQGVEIIKNTNFSRGGVAPETELQHDEMAFTKDFLINKQGGVMTGSTIPELTPEEMERRRKLFDDKVTTRSRPRKVKKED